MQQIDPVSAFTHAALSSLFAGTTTFITSLISGIVVKPMVDVLSQQITSMLAGGMHSINQDGAPVPPPLLPVFPPPIFFSVTPDGTVQFSIPMNKVMEQFMPLFTPLDSMGGQET